MLARPARLRRGKERKNFSVELGEKYLLERRGIDVLADESTLGLTRSKIRPYKRAIYLLADLQRSGVVLRKRRTKRTEVPARFTPILEHYLVMVRSRNNSEGTISKGVSHKMCEAPFAIKSLCEPPVLTGGFSFCPKTKISRLGVFRFLDKSVR